MTTDTGIAPEDQEEHDWAFFMKASNGNESAANFLRLLYHSFYTWDHIVDDEDSFTKKQVNVAFESLAIGIPENPFYQKHAGMLHPMMLNAIIQWHSSNQLKEEGIEEHCDQKLLAAYIIRDCTFMVASTVAYITGGLEYAIDIAQEPWRSWSDTFEEYRESSYG